MTIFCEVRLYWIISPFFKNLIRDELEFWTVPTFYERDFYCLDILVGTGEIELAPSTCTWTSPAEMIKACSILCHIGKEPLTDKEDFFIFCEIGRVNYCVPELTWSVVPSGKSECLMHTVWYGDIYSSVFVSCQEVNIRQNKSGMCWRLPHAASSGLNAEVPGRGVRTARLSCFLKFSKSFWDNLWFSIWISEIISLEPGPLVIGHSSSTNFGFLFFLVRTLIIEIIFNMSLVIL